MAIDDNEFSSNGEQPQDSLAAQIYNRFLKALGAARTPHKHVDLAASDISEAVPPTALAVISNKDAADISNEGVFFPELVIPEVEPDLVEAREIFNNNENVVYIPAGPGKQAAKILKNPVYYMMDHGGLIQSLRPNDRGTFEERVDPFIYATYLFQTQDGTARLLTLPASLYEEREYPGYNAEILEEIYNNRIFDLSPKTSKEIAKYQDDIGRGMVQDEKQSFKDLVRDIAQSHTVGKSFRGEARDYHRVRTLLEGPLLPYQPGKEKSPSRREQSGWDPNLPVPDTLTLVGERALYTSIDSRSAPHGRPRAISSPFSLTNPPHFEAGIISKIVKFNTPKI